MKLKYWNAWVLALATCPGTKKFPLPNLFIAERMAANISPMIM